MATHPRRPTGQRWIKRPPRPSRPLPPKPEIRARPGMTQFLMAVGTGTAAGIVAAILAQLAGSRPGIPGFAAGAGFCLGFILLWRGLGGTVQDLKDMVR
jgi:hypothetical protein